MKKCIWNLGLASLALLLPATAAAALDVAYVVKARTISWMPIRPPDLEQGIAQEAVAALARGDLMSLRQVPAGSKVKADMLLLINGEVVEDAGTFTVNLSLRPLGDSALPSFVTAATVSISGKPKEVMYKSILSAARDAASRMRRALASHPELMGRTAIKGGDEGRWGPMFNWGKVVPLPVQASSKDLVTFLNGRLSWDKRKEAGFRLSGLAFDDRNVRNAIERVALTDPDATVRYYALRFLEPASRVHRFTQTVILAVAREDADPKVKSVAFDLSQHFVGLSPRETLQTWIQLLTSRVADLDNGTFRAVVKQLSFRPATANLDLVLLGCLRQSEVLKEGRERKESCMGLLGKLPPRRRAAVLLGYLNRPYAELSNDLPEKYKKGPVGEAAKILLEDGCKPTLARKVITRLLDETREPYAMAQLIEDLANEQLTPDVVRRAAALLSEATEHDVRSKMMRVLENAVRQHQPPWGVLAWEAAGRAMDDLLGRGGHEDWVERDLKSARKRLDEERQKSHRLGLLKYLRPDAPPVKGAVDYLATCAETAPEERAHSDCLAGLKWLATEYAELRPAALGALQRLSGASLPPRVANGAKNAARDVEFRRKRHARRGAGGESCR